MACSQRELKGLLASGVLADRELTAVSVKGSEQEVLAVAIHPSELVEAHGHGRSVLDRSGRWPVAVATWGGDVAETLRGAYAGDGTVSEVFEAERVSMETALKTLEEGQADSSLPAREEAEIQVRAAERTVGSAPTVDEVLAAVGPEPTDRNLQRWMLEWERTHGLADLDPGGTQEWFDPDPSECHLLFLPTPVSEEALAYVSFWAEQGVVGASPRVLIAVLKSWRERYGAELVANWGTMLQFLVARPPTTLDEAWPLAWEQHRVAPCTHFLPGIQVREAARSLVGADRWFLHERP